jgi:hypothetical protein
MGLFTLGAHRRRSRGVVTSAFFLPLFTQVLRKVFLGNSPGKFQRPHFLEDAPLLAVLLH